MPACLSRGSRVANLQTEGGFGRGLGAFRIIARPRGKCAKMFRRAKDRSGEVRRSDGCAAGSQGPGGDLQGGGKRNCVVQSWVLRKHLGRHTLREPEKVHLQRRRKETEKVAYQCSAVTGEKGKKEADSGV